MGAAGSLTCSVFLGASAPFFVYGGIDGTDRSFRCLWCVLDHFRPMTKTFLCILWALLFLGVVHRAKADSPSTWYAYAWSSVNGPYKADQTTACKAFIDATNAYYSASGAYYAYLSTCNVGQYAKNNNALIGSFYPNALSKQLCWNGSAPDATKPTNQQCPSQCPTSGSNAGNFDFTMGYRTGPSPNSAWASGSPFSPSPAGAGNKYCSSSCEIQLGVVTACGVDQSPTSGYYKSTCTWPATYTGVTCASGEVPPSYNPPPPPTATPPEKDRCPLGTKQVGLDSAGIPICKGDVPDPPKNTNTNTNTTTNADGSKTTTETKTSTNRDGSTTTQTTTTTTNADGSTSSNTTQTVGNTPSGSKGTDDSSDDSKNDLCKLHPDLNVCKNSQISGTCAQVSCDGDAIQCAIAREITNKNCLDKDASDAVKNAPQTDLGNKILSGTDPQASTLPSPTNATTINVGTDLNSSGFGLPSQCLTDVAFQLGTSTWNFRASQVCDWILPLRAVMMIIAGLVSYRIVASAVVNRS